MDSGITLNDRGFGKIENKEFQRKYCQFHDNRMAFGEGQASLNLSPLASLLFWVGHPQMSFHHGKKEANHFKQ
jgi:hypothetical protein